MVRYAHGTVRGGKDTVQTRFGAGGTRYGTETIRYGTLRYGPNTVRTLDG